MNRILVALDSSPRAPFVLKAAIALARSTGGRLRLARAIPVQPEIPWDLVLRFPPGGLEPFLAQRAREELRELSRQVPQANLDGVATAVGPEWSAILAAAAEYHADIIVLGSHGYGLADRFLGTTAAKVVNHAHCSVLVAREAPEGVTPPTRGIENASPSS